MKKSPHKKLFIDSLDRCAVSEDFIPSFYEHFLAVSDEISEKFRNTDFELQNRMLLKSLRLSADATSGVPEALKELRARAESHDRYHLNIEPRFYEHWLSAVVETASDFDPKWNDEIKESWEVVLGYVIKHMIKYY